MDSERGEACKVDRCGTSDVIGEDTGHASTSGFASAVDPTGEMTDFAFDFRTCCPVSGLPLRCGLVVFGLLHATLVPGDSDRATSPSGRATLPQWTVTAHGTEQRCARAVSAPHDRGIEIGRAPHRVGIQIDIEVIFREQPVPVRRRRDFRFHAEALLIETFT